MLVGWILHTKITLNQIVYIALITISTTFLYLLQPIKMNGGGLKQKCTNNHQALTQMILLSHIPQAGTFYENCTHKNSNTEL